MDPSADRRLHSPAAERNAQPILEVLRERLPSRGLVLELASGSGQHAACFAAALPDITWQPSDPETAACRSITAWRAASGLANLREPLVLDVTRQPWPLEQADALVCINMLHIAPWEAGLALLAGAGRLLPAAAPLVVYGPFLAENRPTAPSNARFDADLRRRNPAWGLRDLDQVVSQAGRQGLTLEAVVEMPANNLSVVLRRI